MDVKVGDTVRLKPLRVASVSKYDNMVCLEQAGWVVHSAVESVLPVPLQPGDKARWADETVEIICIKGADAWVERNGHPPKRLTIPLASLTRMP